MNLLTMLRTAAKHKKNKKILSDLFEEVAKRIPEKPAIVFVNEERVWTYRELNEYANQVANYYHSLGLQKGDTAAIFMENCPEYIGVCLGLWKIGVVTALVNHNLRHESLAHCVTVAKSSLLVFSSSLANAVADVWNSLESPLDVSKRCFAVCGDPEGVRQAKRLDRELQGVSTSPPPPFPNKSFEGVCVCVCVCV